MDNNSYIIKELNEAHLTLLREFQNILAEAYVYDKTDIKDCCIIVKVSDDEIVKCIDHIFNKEEEGYYTISRSINDYFVIVLIVTSEFIMRNKGRAII